MGMRGGGPGGQAVAKTSNLVQLIHIPTGVVVKCHESRSLEQNRQIAKTKLVEAVDFHLNSEESVDSQAQRIQKALHEVAKETAKTKRENNLLARLRTKEEELQQKLQVVKTQPENYSQPDHKITALSDELKQIRNKIVKLDQGGSDQDGEGGGR